MALWMSSGYSLDICVVKIDHSKISFFSLFIFLSSSFLFFYCFFFSIKNPLLCLVHYRVSICFLSSSIFLVLYIFSLLYITCLFPFEFAVFFFLSTIPVIQFSTFFFLLHFTFFCLFALKRRFFLRARGSGNAMRFSLRNSRVKISFLYLRGLLALFSLPFFYSFPLLPPPISSTSSRQLREKSLHRRTEHLPPGFFCHSLYIYASTNSRVFSFDFLLSRAEIDRFFLYFQSNFSFFDFRVFSYRRDLHRMTFVLAKTRYKRFFRCDHRNATTSVIKKKERKKYHREVEFS